MHILDWILAKFPGAITRLPDRIEVDHATGDRSILWLRIDTPIPTTLDHLGALYQDYDGMDLFSSTFKFASIDKVKGKNGVPLVFTLESISRELIAAGERPSEISTPFMYQAGIGIYSVAHSSGIIYEWDTELRKHGSHYTDVFSILEEWYAAIIEK